MKTLAILLAGLLIATTVLAGLYIYKYRRLRRDRARLKLALRDARMATWQMIVLLEDILDQRPPGAPLDERLVAILDHLLDNSPQADNLRHWHALPQRTKMIFKLYVAGLTQAELASRFDLSRDQVRARLKNAGQALGADDIRIATARAGKYDLLDDVL